jgi:hypothetical protein
MLDGSQRAGKRTAHSRDRIVGLGLIRVEGDVYAAHPQLCQSPREFRGNKRACRFDQNLEVQVAGVLYDSQQVLSQQDLATAELNG